MILTPAIIALVAFALVVSLIGVQILQRWDLRSGAEGQLRLERRTYLVSTVIAYLLAFEIFSLFLFIYTADRIHPLFVGAMCAAGALYANGWGYPTLVLKPVNVLLSGIWLLVNHADNQAPDYPLIDFKYRWLLALTALLTIEALFQWDYFRGIAPDMMTSCCGTLFAENAPNVAGDIAALSPRAMQVLFFLAAALLLRTGIHLRVTGRGAALFEALSLWFFWLSLAAVISFVSVYYYELPTHHCPFDILQREYHYIGYPLYAALVVGGIFGTGTGSCSASRRRPRWRGSYPLCSGDFARWPLVLIYWG